jgi:hypothetical protein
MKLFSLKFFFVPPLLQGLLTASFMLASPAQASAAVVPNGGFEDGLQGWSEIHPATADKGQAEVQSADAKEGKSAVRLTAPTNKSIVGVVSPAIPLAQSSYYALRGWYKTTGKPEVLEIRVRPLDAKGQALAPWQEYNYQFLRLTPASNWQRINRPLFVHPAAKALDITLWWSRGTGSVIYDDIQLVPIPAPEVASQAHLLPSASNQNAIVWSESTLKKIYPDSKPPQKSLAEISLSAAAGEYEATQIVVQPRREIKALQVRFSDFQGPQVLSAQQFSARFVGYINVETPRATFGRSGLLPDPLLPDVPATLTPQRPQPIWVTVQVPRQTSAGIYRGSITLEGDGLPAVSIPLRLRVYDFELPPHPSLNTIARIWQFHEGERDTFRRNLIAHRISGESTVAALPIKVSPDGRVEINWTDWDVAAQKYFGELGMTVFNVPHVYLGDASGFYNKENKWNGLEIGSEVWQKALADYAKQVADHLRARGWLQYALWQIWDEPSTPEIKATVRQITDTIHQVAPDARIYLTTHPQSELFGAVNIWGVPQSVFDVESVAARRAAGDTIWTYWNELYSLDPDASSMKLRLFPWVLQRYGISGVEWWAVSQWKSDPYQVPNQYPPQNGGGFFLYPNPTGKGAPVDSIRWEAYRDGVEDYDYLTLLAQAQDAALQKLKINDAALSGTSLVKVLLGQVTSEDFGSTLDPSHLRQTRDLAAQLISFSCREPAVALNFKYAATGAVQISGAAAAGTVITNGKNRVTVGENRRFTLNAAPATELEFTQGKQTKGLPVPGLRPEESQ